MENIFGSVTIFSKHTEYSDNLQNYLNSNGFKTWIIQKREDVEPIFISNHEADDIFKNTNEKTFYKDNNVYNTSESLIGNILNYLIYLSPEFGGYNNDYDLFDFSLEISRKYSTKSIYLFNFLQFNTVRDSLEEKINKIKFGLPTAGIIFIPIYNEKTIDVNEKLYRLNSGLIYSCLDLIEIDEIVKRAILSLKYFSTSTLFSSQVLNIDDLKRKGFNINKIKTLKEVSISLIENKESIRHKIYIKNTSREGKKEIIKDNQTAHIDKSVINRIVNTPYLTSVKKRIIEVKRRDNNHKKNIDKSSFKNIRRIVFKCLSIFILMVLLPVIIDVFGSVNFIIARNYFNKGDLNLSKKTLKFSERSYFLAREISRIYYSKLYIKPYKYIYSTSEVLGEASNIGIIVLDTFEDIINLKKQNYYLETFEKSLNLNLKSIINKINFIHAGTKEFSGYQRKVFEISSGVEDFNEVKTDLSNFLVIAKDLNNLLGNDRNMNYLFLLQDENQLRPSGGKIKEAFIITVFKGKVVSVNYLNLNELDKNFKGYIKSPQYAVRYLGLNKWKIEEGNWNINFADASSDIIKFFLSSQDLKIDGVIAINTSALFDKLNIRISNNDDLTNNIFKYINSLNEKNFTNNLFKLFELLQQKDINIFVNNSDAMQGLALFKWTGEIYTDVCEKCYKDSIFIVFTNLESLSMDKLKIENDIEISFQENLLKRSLKIFISNEADSIFKSYLRVVVPQNVGLGLGEIVSKNENGSFKPDTYGLKNKKEAGFLVELKPGETKAYILKWESGVGNNFYQEGEYSLYIQKQPGMNNYPVAIKITTNSKMKDIKLDNLNLTERENYVYNTSLSRDFISRIFWKL